MRGLGLLIAVELRDGDAGAVAAGCSTRGVLVNAVTPTALRLCPPLCLSTADADRAVEALRGASLLDRSLPRRPRRSRAPPVQRAGSARDVGVPPGLLRLYHAARAFAFGYFFGLGFLALTHYVSAWPDDVRRGGRVRPARGRRRRVVAWIAREASGPRSA